MIIINTKMYRDSAILSLHLSSKSCTVKFYLGEIKILYNFRAKLLFFTIYFSCKNTNLFKTIFNTINSLNYFYSISNYKSITTQNYFLKKLMLCLNV